MAEEATQRRTAHQIFKGVAQNGRDELSRPALALAFSGLAGGLTMGLTGLAVAVMRANLQPGPVQQVLTNLIYPVGFVAVIIGRAQLFTENTLYPVVLILDERKHVLNTARLWAVVLAANLAGSLAFALMAVNSGGLKPEYVSALVELGKETVQGGFAHLFWSGVIGGWLIALVAWMVTASLYTIGQLAVIYLLTFLVGLGRFAHCVANSGEILAAVAAAAVPASAYLKWLLPATLGNIFGGVTIVSLLNYGQVAAGQEE